MNLNLIRFSLFFPQDGAPCHSTPGNLAYLAKKYGHILSKLPAHTGEEGDENGDWIGTTRVWRWPAKSPDMSVNDNWLFAPAKEYIFSDPAPTTVEELWLKTLEFVEVLNQKPASIRKGVRAQLGWCRKIMEKGGEYIK